MTSSSATAASEAESPAANWLVPCWPVPAPVVAYMTTRAGGVSTGNHAAWRGDGGLNLGAGCGDAPEAVATNRRLAATAMGAPILWLAQVHGATVIDGDRTDPHDRPQHGDAAFTTRAGIALAVMAADCLPVLVADRAGRIVGAAHGGWRGLAAGVVGALVDALRARLPDADLMAWLGPRIGPSAFEVGPEVRDAFITRSTLHGDAFVASPNSGRWLGDLGAIARVELAAHDVARITDSALCTVSDPARFWSHRRDRPGGRMAALIRRVADGVAV